MKRVAHMLMLGSVLGLVGFWLVAGAQSSIDLVRIDSSGWWTRRPGAQQLGAGKFEVAAGVQGEESVAALRVLINGEVTKATLALAETNAPLKDVAPGKLKVCPTSQPWLKTEAGAYADAPKPDCSTAVELQRKVDAAGAASWSGDITSMLSGARSEVSLMIVPIVDSAAVVPSTYYIAMVAGVVADGTPDAMTAAPTVPKSPAPVASPATPSRVTPPSSVSTPSPTTVPAAPTPTTAPIAAPANQPRRFQVAASSKPGKPWGKLFLLVPLAAVLGALYTAAQRFAAERSLTAN